MSAATMMRLRPFCGQATCRKAVTLRTHTVRVYNLHSAQVTKIDKDEVDGHALLPSLPLAIPVVLGAIGVSAQSAFADEVSASLASTVSSVPTISAEDAQILAASSAAKGPLEEVFVSILFGIVVFLLVIVTGGVAYINIKQFLDSRQEKDDREKASVEFKVVSPSGSSKDKSDDDEMVSLRRAGRVKKEKGKGFAAQEFTSRR